MNKNNEIFYKNDNRSIYSFFALVVTVPLIAVIGYALSFIPNTLDIEFIKKTYVLPLKDFTPENSETYQYMFLSVMFPILFFSLFMIFSNYSKKRDLRPLYVIIYPLQFFMVCVLSIWSVLGNYCGLIGLSTLENYIYTGLMVISIIMASLMLSMFCVYKENTKRVKDILKIPVLVIGIAVSLGASWLYIARSYLFNSYTLHHFDAYYYPVFEVFHGKTLLVDFNSLYGFYPYIMAPLFKLMGGISMYRFSILIAILVFINIAAIGGVFWINIKNKTIALTGFIAFIFVCILSSMTINEGFYLQYVPHRTLFPSLIILVCSLLTITSKVSRQRIITVLGYAICSLSLFWNIDTGAVVIITWCLFLMYREAMRHTIKEKTFYFNCIKTVLFTLFSALLAYGAVDVITYLRAGQLAGPKNMISGQILFKGTGFYMLPMKLQHPWIILAIIYATGLVKALSGLSLLKKKDIDKISRRDSIYFVLSILGVGVFSYYQGRSHDSVFVAVLWPGIIMITLFASEYLSRIVQQFNMITKSEETLPIKSSILSDDSEIAPVAKNNDIVISWFLRFKKIAMLNKVRIITDVVKLVVLTGILISLSISSLILDSEDNAFFISLQKNHIDKSYETPIQNRIAFIKKNTEKNEDIDLLVAYFTEYYTIMELKNPMPLRSAVDWFTKGDYEKIIDYLEVTHNKVFIDVRTSNMILAVLPGQFKDVMSKRFKLISTFDSVGYYSPVDKS